MLLLFVLASCSKTELVNSENNINVSGYLKFGGSSMQNNYGLVCNISAGSRLISTNENWMIDYTIENTSSVDFNKPIYISLDLIYNKPDFPLGEYLGDYYSLLYWEQTSWGRTTKIFELKQGDVFNDSVNIVDIGWISFISSAIQPAYGNFYELFETGIFKFQISIIVDDSEDIEIPPLVIYSNLLDLTIS